VTPEPRQVRARTLAKATLPAGLAPTLRKRSPSLEITASRLVELYRNAVGEGVAAEPESSDSEADGFRVQAGKTRVDCSWKRRLDKMLASLDRVPDGMEVSFLELESVGRDTLKSYLGQVGLFFDSGGRLEAADEEVDKHVVDWMNAQYLAGVKPAAGSRLLAALMCLVPAFSKSGGRHIPRSLRALKGWKRLYPAKSKRPYGWPVWCALMISFIRKGKTRLAAMVLLMVITYLRPKELLMLTSRNFSRPTSSGVNAWVLVLFPQEGAARSKTNESDDTVPINSVLARWMDPIWEALKNESSLEPLIGMDYPALLKEFKSGSAEIGLEMSPGLGRHSGASIDRALALRSLAEIQKMGRWATFASVRRYEKEGRINDSWASLSPAQQAYCMVCERELQTAMLRNRAPALPAHLQARAK
jgi:hypothetical protein